MKTVKTTTPDKGCYSLIISILSIIIAGCAAFTLPFDCDKASFVLGTLTMLVALLVGWQIYSTIDVKSQISKATKASEELEQLKKKIEIESKSAIFVSLAQLGRSAFNKVDLNNNNDTKEKTDAIQSLLNALCLWEREMETPLAKEAYQYCITKLPLLIRNTGFSLESAEEKDAYVTATMKTGLRELIDFATQIEITKTRKE